MENKKVLPFYGGMFTICKDKNKDKYMLTQDWKEARHPEEKIVLKNGEYFRRALEEALNTSNRGTAKAISIEVGYSNQSMITNIVKGKRIPDFKKAVLIAHYLGSDFIEFLIRGRHLIEPRHGLVAVEHRQRDPWDRELRESFQKLRQAYQAENPQLNDLINKMLSTASEIASFPKTRKTRKKIKP